MRRERLKAFQPGRWTSDRGQSVVFVLLALSLFLIAAIGLTVDVTNLWFHRQMAQGAADAACTAGAMDMYIGAARPTFPSTAHFTPGTAFDCGNTTPNTDPSSAPAPCWYASENGYASPRTFGGLVAGKASNNVYGSFPSSIKGVTTPPTTYSSYPFLRIDIVDRVQVFFMALLTASRTQDVRVFSECGLQVVKGPLPLAVLSSSLTTQALSGIGIINVVGGGNRSIQVNASYNRPVSGLNFINLCQAGPDYCGGSMGVWGAEAQPLFFVTSCSGGTPPCLPGPQRTPTWDVPSAPTPDPLAQVTAPTAPGTSLTAGGPATVPNGTNGCVVTSGCDDYKPGSYPAGLCVKTGTNCPGMAYHGINSTAIFETGVYYITGGMYVDAGSCVRPSAADTSGIGGTVFYFSDTNTISFNSSGSSCPTSYNPTSTAPVEKCTNGSNPPTNVPTTISGSVLLAPCTGTYGDPLLAAGGIDASGTQQRGILFFQNRSSAGVNPIIGGGQFLAAGVMYFHSSAFNDTLSLGTSSTTYVLGGIVADQITMTGGTVTVNLSTSPAYSLLKTSVLR